MHARGKFVSACGNAKENDEFNRAIRFNRKVRFTMTAAISIQNVSKAYGENKAVNDLSLEIQRGQFFGLLGENGAGKSTLISMIAGLTRTDAGMIRIHGQDVVENYRDTRRALGVVPQELIDEPFFSIRELLKIQAGYFGLGKEQEAWIDELLGILALSDKADKKIGALSGGMKRRVLIAMALVHDPDVIILDEPTAGVDVTLRRSMWDFIRALHAKGKTIVLTTHYLEEAEALCDRIGIIQQGRLVALEDKTALMARHGDMKLEQIFLDLTQQAQEVSS